MPIIQRPDLVAKIRKTYELLGPDAVATLSPELVPVVIVDDISEQDPGDATRYGWGFISVAGSGGQYGQGWLWNPAGSGIHCYLEQLQFSNYSGTGNHALTWFNTAGTATGTEINRGIGAGGLPACSIQGADVAVPAGATIGQYRATNDKQVLLKVSFRLLPGEGIGVTGPVATGLYLNFAWREIAARV